jgi:hypothetical protein
VGLLLLNPDQQLHYVAAAGRPRRALGGWCSVSDSSLIW